MTKTNKVLAAESRLALKGKWQRVILTIFVAYALSASVSFIPTIGGLVSLLISGPITAGISIFSLKLIRKQDAQFEDVFKGFTYYLISLKTYVIMTVYILLWSLLLIIPGIIKALSYSMAFFILADNPTLGAREILKKSSTMMYGYKWKYFCLNLRFLGWALLCILTLGIGFLWLIPYVQVSLAAFYEDIKGETRHDVPTQQQTPTPAVPAHELAHS